MFLDFVFQAAGTATEVAQEASSATLKDNDVLALVGGIIVAGFLGNLIFKYAKIPSVIKLMGLGVVLGPVLGLADPEALLQITPFFGKVALLIILFAGGLKLNIETVIAQLGKAVSLAFLAFGLTFALSYAVSFYLILPGDVLQSFILATLMSGTASSIVIPVVNKLSVSEEVKSLLSIESALSNLLILVVVIIACDFSLNSSAGGSTDFLPLIGDFLIKIIVSLVMAAVFGILWSRIMGAMRKESLAYMLTLGFIFLLNYLVDRLNGNGPISILFFAIVLANVSRTTAAWAPKLQAFFGIQVDATNFALNEFLKGISEELSFLVTTFFFVLLGSLITFDTLNLELMINIGILTGCILAGRAGIVFLFTKIGKKKYEKGEPLIIFSMMPRGLATAIMAFLPASAAYMIPNTEAFPTYAMFAILASNLIMTLFVALGEMRLKKGAGAKGELAAGDDKEGEEPPENEEGDAPPEDKKEPPASDASATEETTPALSVKDEKLDSDTKAVEAKIQEEPITSSEGEATTPAQEPEKLKSFTEHLYSWLKVEDKNVERLDQNSVRSIRMRDLIFWIRVVSTVLVATLGMMMDRSEVVLVAMLFSPIAPLVNTIGLAILTGDVYMFLKGIIKTVLMVVLIIGVACLMALALPFTGLPEQVASRMTPTVMDFGLALLGGLITPIVLLRGRRLENLAITPIVSILIFPPLIILGYAFGAGYGKDFFGELIAGGSLSFSANFTAMLIGILISLWVLRLTKHKASAYIKEWKEREIEEGELHSWFERLHLVRFLEFVGTPFARIFVLAILAAALFVPLTTTLHGLVKEYDTSEIVEKYGYANFEIENRSSILSTDHQRSDSALSVKIRVATSTYFQEDDVKVFEDEVTRELKIPVRLSLIQSQGNMNFVSGLSVESGGGAIVESDHQSMGRRLEQVRSSLSSAIETLPTADGVNVFAYNMSFGSDSADISVNLEYLAPKPLTDYAENLMQLHIAEKIGLPTGNVRMAHFPHAYSGESTDPGTYSDSTGEQSPVYILEKANNISAWVSVPAGANAEADLKIIEEQLKGLNDQVDVKLDPNSTDRYGVRFE